ncbi:unnamed protein product, partial [Meganyctiphanes norvegica]
MVLVGSRGKETLAFLNNFTQNSRFAGHFILTGAKSGSKIDLSNISSPSLFSIYSCLEIPPCLFLLALHVTWTRRRCHELENLSISFSSAARGGGHGMHSFIYS